MDYEKEYGRIMSEQVEIALATCVDGEPNVRIVNFCYKENMNGIIYFSTFGDNQKVEEFAKNASVAFTTIPNEGNAHVRVKNGTVRKSNKTIYDLREEFIKRIPDYAMTIEQAGEYLIVYEIEFHTIDVTIDFENIGSMTI
ncbi:MAG: pyridoxamine 5-phosphate oxidase [Firmicutes bacterium HGW-Firmicutes-2]|jgi:uncharacterized pyridoxamine 5'-phosphate oxidase family protein|nr:MAG: pyridoxamine 5-phosphate oxidase [Firmicutes bacterium HGW-Firmicutes-2]